MNERLYRAREDRMFLGVLGGIAARLGVDPSLVRVAYAIVTLLTGIFPLVIVYFVMAIVIPEAPEGWEAAMHAAAAAPPPPGWMQPREPGAPPPPPSTAWPAAGADATAGADAAAAGADVAAAAAASGATAAGATATTSASGVVPAEAGGPGWAAIAPSPQPNAPGAQEAAAGGPAWGSGYASPPASAPPGPVPGWGAATAADATRHANDARTGAIVGGLILVGLGGAFLLAQVAPEVDWGIVGPVLLIVLGAGLIIASFRRS